MKRTKFSADAGGSSSDHEGTGLNQHQLRKLLSRDNMQAITKVAFVGNYLPRKCGIATFTHDLRNAVAEAYPNVECTVIAMNDIEEGYAYGADVRFEIEEQNPVSYVRAADFINSKGFDVVCVQHEYGIYGGPCGDMLLPFLKALRVPIVTTLHTILRQPSPEQQRVLSSILSIATNVITMAEKGQQLLQSVYNAPRSKVKVIAHGIPEMDFAEDTDKYKQLHGISGHRVILTFGLLSPNKGVEVAIKAMAQVVKQFPDALYVILGQTHPALIRENGEAYRNSLDWLAKDLGISENVHFVNKFVDLPLLKQYIAACDVYLTPYLFEEQITSGTLSYAFGMGTAVVSTPYWHAQELLADNRGIIVPFKDSDKMADAIIDLFANEEKRFAIRKGAFEYGRSMTWSNSAKAYFATFEDAVVERFVQIPIASNDTTVLPDIKLDHFIRMTDDTGMLQHAKFAVPHLDHGYCTDDNCRALLLAVKLKAAGFHWTPQLDICVTRFCSFLDHAFNEEQKRFRNFLTYDRKWLEEIGSEDSHARTLWALGAAVRYGVNHEFATDCFRYGLDAILGFTSPRSWAFALLGAKDYMERFPGDGRVIDIMGKLCDKLVDIYKRVNKDGWRWFEEKVTYDNGVLPQALIVAGGYLRRPDYANIGLEALSWLADIQTVGGTFSPVGNHHWMEHGKAPSQFDQQPLEAGGMVLACVSAYRHTEMSLWRDRAFMCFDWFMGRNVHGRPLYNAATCGCFDGLHSGGVNQNQGAESLLAFMLALVELKECHVLDGTPATPAFKPSAASFS